MATLTLNYDGRNKSARAIVEMLRSLDFFKVSEPKAKADAPTLMSKEEFFKMVDERMESYEKGNYIAFSSPEEMHKYFAAI